MRTNSCIGIKVPDLQKARKFYGDVLGLKIVEEESGENLLVIDSGTLMIYIERSDMLQPPVPSFSVQNIDEIRQKVLNEGCEIISEFKNGFWFKDPFGITYDVISS
jgi:catechol 2,3-dioxygenase-like lactoylglutathione lyase family enzyme